MPGVSARAARRACIVRSRSCRKSSTSRWRSPARTRLPRSDRMCWSATERAGRRRKDGTPPRCTPRRCARRRPQSRRERALSRAMTAEVTIKDGARLEPHPLRAGVWAEGHARPFTPLQSPRRLLHFAFETTSDTAKGDRAALTDFCARRGLAPLRESAKQHRIAFGGTVLRWEQHSEFTTYTWELSADCTPFHPPAVAVAAPMAELPQPGPVLVALDLHLVVGARARFGAVL